MCRCKASQSSSKYVCQTQMNQQHEVRLIRAFLHTIYHMMAESQTLSPSSPHQITSSTTATVPSPSIAKVRCIRRLHMCAKRKLHSSKLFRRSGPTYTPYHMMAESRPLYLLIRLIRSPLRLQRRYQAHPLQIGRASCRERV